MLTVSNFANKSIPVRVASKANYSFKNNVNNKVAEEDNDLDYYHNIKEDELVKKNTWLKRIGINYEKTIDIPFVHYPRGLAGASDFSFFEFLQTAKLPFYVGGPVLAALFYAGVKKDNMKAAKAAKMVAKHIALGVGFYYAGAALARFIVNTTTKLTRGVDLNQPYARAVSTSVNQSGKFKKNVEFHKVMESVDFTRWDLLYNKKAKSHNEINSVYSDFAKKYGIKKETNDIDSTMKPLIKKTITMARAWQYALTAFYVTLGIGIANQKAWEQETRGGFKNLISQGVFGKNQTTENRLHALKVAVYDHMIEPFGKSFGQFWKGTSKASSIAGKSVIISSVLATLTAITLLTGKTSGSSQKIVATKKQNNEVTK